MVTLTVFRLQSAFFRGALICEFKTRSYIKNYLHAHVEQVYSVLIRRLQI